MCSPRWGEQREIVNILNVVDQKADLHKQKRLVVECVYRSRLNKLMTGEILVSNLELAAIETTTLAQVSA